MKQRNLLLLSLIALCGCSTVTSTDTTGKKVVVHQLDPQGIEAVNNAVLNALNSPAVSNALFEATRPKP